MHKTRNLKAKKTVYPQEKNQMSNELLKYRGNFLIINKQDRDFPERR